MCPKIRHSAWTRVIGGFGLESEEGASHLELQQVKSGSVRCGGNEETNVVACCWLGSFCRVRSSLHSCPHGTAIMWTFVIIYGNCLVYWKFMVINWFLQKETIKPKNIDMFLFLNKNLKELRLFLLYTCKSTQNRIDIHKY